MCGIAGILNRRSLDAVPVETIGQMIATLVHRGPDEFGLYRDSHVALGSARLSIVDLAGGQQPMANEDGTLWVVFNGEIFNHVELRPGLEARGHRFGTHSDTEVILHLYEEYGPDCLKHLNGQFAIALWDAHHNSLFLARDRMGIRPLFYTTTANQLIFGSEVKAILAAPGVKAELDPEALRQVFTFWSVLAPRSMFRDICELPPGHFMIARGSDVEVRSYWSLDFTEARPRRADDDYLEELSAGLVDAARIRLRADVPVGAYLSGGLDSSLVASLVRQHTHRLDTFSIAFSDAAFDERGHQRQMAAFLGTQHQEITCTPEDIGRVFPDVIWHTETPILRTAPAPMYLLSALVRRHGYKVVLTGEGADELLAGYDLFKEMKIRRFWARQPESQLRPLLLQRLYPDIPRLAENRVFAAVFYRQGLQATASPYYSHQIRWGSGARLRRFLAEGMIADAAGASFPAHLPSTFADWSDLAKAQYLEITTFLWPYLLSAQGDRVAMAHSVEGRYPFLDYRVVDFCNRLPADLKLRGLHDKWLLRQLGRRTLPAEIWQRRKQPYRAPIQRSFMNSSRDTDYVRELLAPAAVRKAGYFQSAPVERLVRKAMALGQLSAADEMALVGILSTQLVDHLFLRRGGWQLGGTDLSRYKVVDRVAMPLTAKPSRSKRSVSLHG
jgi:asparagine synthase (glutamine-hydrolysing)